MTFYIQSMTESHEQPDETVRVTVSMPKSILRTLDAAAKNQRPKASRSGYLQQLIYKDIDCVEGSGKTKSK